jgi:hypothetical protein
MRSDGVPQQGQSAVTEVETRRATAVVGVRTTSSRWRSAVGRRLANTPKLPISEYRAEKGRHPPLYLEAAPRVILLVNSSSAQLAA